MVTHISLHKSLHLIPSASKIPLRFIKNKEQTRITRRNIYNYDKGHMYIIKIIRALTALPSYFYYWTRLPETPSG